MIDREKLIETAARAIFEAGIQPWMPQWVDMTDEQRTPHRELAWAAFYVFNPECAHESWEETGQSRQCTDCRVYLDTSSTFLLDESERCPSCGSYACDCYHAPADDDREVLARHIGLLGNPMWDGETLRLIDWQIADVILAAGFRRSEQENR